LFNANQINSHFCSSIEFFPGISKDAKLTLNARVEMKPEDLDSVVAEVLFKVCGDKINKEVSSLKCLSPGRPDPTYRYDYVVV